jgi:hypothetical protein
MGIGMSFREGETETFPFERTDSGIWYAMILFDGRFPRHSYTSSKSQKRNLIEDMTKKKQEGQKFLIMGIWHGQWKTDIFILDEETTLRKLLDNI